MKKLRETVTGACRADGSAGGQFSEAVSCFLDFSSGQHLEVARRQNAGDVQNQGKTTCAAPSGGFSSRSAGHALNRVVSSSLRVRPVEVKKNSVDYDKSEDHLKARHGSRILRVQMRKRETAMEMVSLVFW